MNTRLAAAALLLALPLAVPAPAAADIGGGSIRHYSPDGGYDAPISVYCDGRWRSLPEGEHSDHICNDEDVDRMRVPNAGVNIRCASPTGWFERLDGDDGLVTKVAWFQNLECVSDLD